MKNSKINYLIFTLAAVFSLIGGTALACGPFFTNYIYSLEDINRYVPLQEGFLNGSYGVIPEGFGIEYAYPVYQDLIGKKITPETMNELEVIYKNGYYNQYMDSSTTAPVDEWYAARKLVTGEPGTLIKTDFCQNWQCYENCHGDTFILAAETLKNRMSVFTKDQLKTWVAGQDRVFSYCGNSDSGSSGKINIANMAASMNDAAKNNIGGIQGFFAKIFSSIRHFFSQIFTFLRDVLHLNGKTVEQNQNNTPANGNITTTDYNTQLLKYDQEYQSAAIAFYQGDYDSASKQFKAITDNPNQPWRAYAALALGRTYIRKGNENIYNNSQNGVIQYTDENFKLAKDQFQSILNNAEFAVAQDGARALLDYINYRIDPAQRLKDATAVLASSKDPKEIARNLDDLSSLLSYSTLRFLGSDTADSQKNIALIKECGGDFLQWYYVWESSDNNFDFAFSKYKETKTLPWLLACLKLVSPTNNEAKSIIDDSSKISDKSPAYMTVQYYRLKLLAQMSDAKDAAKQEIANIIINLSSNGSSSYIAYNDFSDLMMNTATDLDTAARYSQRYVVGSLTDADSTVSKHDNEIGKTMLDKKFKSLMNQYVPLDKWNSIASGNPLPTAEIKKYVQIVTFTRAVLLERWDIAKNMANLLAKDNSLATDLKPFLNAQTADEQKFTAAIFILRNPQVRKDLTDSLDDYIENGGSFSAMDDYRRNWWGLIYNQADMPLSLQNVISDQDRQIAARENNQMESIIAPNYLCEIVINYGTAHPDNALVPEALARSVDATRYAGEKDSNTGNFSKQAFTLLHNNYSGSSWAKQTPYWYGEND